MKGGSWRCFLVCAVAAAASFAVYNALGRSPTVPGIVQSPDGDRTFNVSLGQEIIDSLCALYESDQVSGDYCNRLCFFKKHDIIDLATDNKVVITILLGGQKTVLKARSAHFGDFPQMGVQLPEDEFSEAVVAAGNAALGLGWPMQRRRQFLELVWPARRRSGTMRPVDRKSLWALVGQSEYLTFSVLHLARVFPKVIGSCGHFYVVEHVVPFKLKSYYTSLRAKILVHLMGTLKLFYEFLNEPLHWCDVRFENFGLSAEYPKRFLVMDGDDVFTETRLARLLEDRRCAADADCSLKDCTSSCNSTIGHCTARSNDNVDVFCAKLVKELFGSFWSTSNRYLAACHDAKLSPSQRLKELRLVWAWSLSDV